MRELLSRDAGSPASGPRYQTPSDRPGRWTAAARAVGCLAAVITVAATAAAGLWFGPFAAGLAIGLVAQRPRFRVVLPVAAAVAAAGWAVPLAWQAGRGEPIGATARTIGALAGLPASAVLLVSLTLLIAVIQAIVGAFLARSVVWR